MRAFDVLGCEKSESPKISYQSKRLDVRRPAKKTDLKNLTRRARYRRLKFKINTAVAKLQLVLLARARDNTQPQMCQIFLCGLRDPSPLRTPQ